MLLPLFSLLSLTIHTCFAGWFQQCPLYFFFLCTKMSTKRFFHLQKSKASSPVKQTAGDVLAVSCETVLIVAKESFVHFSAIGEKKTCSLLLCRPWPGCLKRLFRAYLASLANPVMLEVTFRVKLQYTQKRSNKK